MKISLRPHHFLCLQGYKGYNYSNIQKLNWNIIANILKNEPETDILITSGKDDLCSNCIDNISVLKNRRCIESNVEQLDKKIAKILKISEGETHKYNNILKKLKETITPQIHEKLCSSCEWWKKGLCQNSFNNK